MEDKLLLPAGLLGPMVIEVEQWVLVEVSW
jgi:hypothetical protein